MRLTRLKSGVTTPHTIFMALGTGKPSISSTSARNRVTPAGNNAGASRENSHVMRVRPGSKGGKSLTVEHLVFALQNLWLESIFQGSEGQGCSPKSAPDPPLDVPLNPFLDLPLWTLPWTLPWTRPWTHPWTRPWTLPWTLP